MKNTKAEPKTEKSPALAAGADPAPGQFQIAARSKVKPDPNQPRKDFNEGALEELAWSIYRQGILQPLIVKLVPGLKIKEPDMIEKEWQAVDGAGAVVFKGAEAAVKKFAEGKTDDFYQIIAGERRYRASGPREFKPEPGRNEESVKWPGLSALPVMVREVSEQDIFALQHIENLQRANLSALEDAQSFAQELEKRKRTDPTMTPEKLGAELGIKRGTVYNRLKLLRLHEPVRKALLDGQIETMHAIALATIPDPKKQEEKLEDILEAAEYGEGLVSFRHLEEAIEDEYAKPLKGAPFDIDDVSLVLPQWKITIGGSETVIECARPPHFPNLLTIGVPKLISGVDSRPEEYGKVFVTDKNGLDLVGPIPNKQGKEIVKILSTNTTPTAVVVRMGGGACKDCPHRSGVMNPDAKSPNICALPSCFSQKLKAHWLRKAADLQAKGTQVLTESEFRKEKSKYVAGDKQEYTQSGPSGTFEHIMGKHKPEPTLVATSEGIKKFYPIDEAMAAARKNGAKFYSHNQPQTPEEKQKDKEKEEAREARSELREKIATEALPLVAESLAKLKDDQAWKIVADNFSDCYIDPKKKKVLLDAQKGDRNRALALLLASSPHDPVEYSGEWDKDVVSLYKAMGVDLLALEKKALEEQKAKAELALKKPDAKQKELLTAPKSKAPKKKGGVKPKTKKHK